MSDRPLLLTARVFRHLLPTAWISNVKLPAPFIVRPRLPTAWIFSLQPPAPWISKRRLPAATVFKLKLAVLKVLGRLTPARKTPPRGSIARRKLHPRADACRSAHLEAGARRSIHPMPAAYRILHPLSLTAVCAVVLLCAIAPAVHGDDEKDVASRVTSVTVYPDRAMIERTATVQLSPGRHHILFPGLPSSIDRLSFRVRGRARSPVTILGSDTKTVLHKEAVDTRVRSLEEEIAKLEAEKNQVLARLEVIKNQKEFVESVRSTTTELLSKELGLGKIDTKTWKEAFDFVGGSLGDLAEGRLTLEAQAKDLGDQIALLTAELERLRRTSPKESYTVAADLEVGAPGGEVELFLTYLTRGATWAPSYDARFLPEDGIVEMTAYGVVAQTTGEDWTNVELALSTARPATGAAPPDLAAWLLDVEPPRMAEKRADQMYRAGRALAEEPDVATEVEGMALQAGLTASQVAALQIAALAKAGVTATYNVPAKEDVPADGNPVKTGIGQMSFSPELKHAATPLVVEKAYLSSDVVNDSEHTLLPGRVDVFVGPDMVGGISLDKPVVPGETFHISFGTDPEVKVKREIIKKETSRAGKNKMRRLESLKISLHNYKDKPVAVTLKDRVPVSRNKEIDVDIEKLEPEPESVSPEGIAEWKLQVAPGEQVEVFIEYRITYPAGQRVRGL